MSVPFLRDLFMTQEKLLCEPFYNQPRCDENNSMIRHCLETMSIQEVNEAHRLFLEKRKLVRG